MKKKILKSIILVIIFLIALIINKNVYASNFNTSLIIDKNNQDTNRIVLVLKLKDVNFENTISTIEGNIEYDKSIFTDVSLENLNNWSIVYNNEEKANGKFIGFKISEEKIREEEICKITFKINDNVENANTNISVKNIKSADGDNLVATEDRNINIVIGNSEILNVKDKNQKISKKTTLKYVLILVIIALLLTISTSTMYLIQKYKLKKKYNQ